MKTQYYLFILIILISCSEKSVRENDLKKMNLNGEVKSVKVSQYKAVLNNGVIEKEKFENSENLIHVDNYFLFNTKGMIIEQKEYLSDKLNNRTLFHYDKNLNILKKEYYNSAGKLEKESIFENTQNSKGELTEEKEFTKGIFFKGKWVAKKFKDKKEISKVNYSGNDIIKSHKYEYDEKGNLVKEIRYDIDGNIFINISNLFNENNYRIQEIVLDDKNNIISKENYEYLEFDSFNNIKKILISENKTPTSFIEFELEYYK